MEFKVITPMRTALEAEVNAVHLTSTQGEIEILPDHTDLITSVQHGELTYKDSTGTHSLFIGGGFLQVEANHILLVTDTAVEAEEIDIDTVEEALEKAKAALRNRSSVLSREEEAYIETKIAQQLALIDFKKRRH